MATSVKKNERLKQVIDAYYWGDDMACCYDLDIKALRDRYQIRTNRRRDGSAISVMQDIGKRYQNPA